MKDDKRQTNSELVQQEGTLRSEGRRLTSQRLILLDIINSTEDHLDADALHQLAKEKDPRISLSTVYRTLSLLKQLRMVEELHLAEDHHHYEVRSKQEHYHLVCLRCGRVVEFNSPLIEKLGRDLTRSYGFIVVETEIDVSGICDECQQASGTENGAAKTANRVAGGHYER